MATILVFLGALAIASPVAAQEAPREKKSLPFGQGTHAFRRILHDLKLEPLASVEEFDADPAHSVLVALGDITVLIRMSLNRVDPQGAAVLMASDHDGAEFFGYRVIHGVRVRDDQVAVAYRGKYLDCPIVVPRNAQPPLFHGLNRVVTNRPGFFHFKGELGQRFSVLATFPDGCFVSPPTPPQINASRRPFAIAAEQGKGRVVMLSDHSVFINDMMLQDDTDNIDLAYNALEWLMDGPERRTKVLYVEDGIIRTDFNIPLKELPAPDIFSWINKVISGLEREDMFTRMLHELIPPNVLLRLLTVLFTLGLVVYGGLRLGRSRHGQEKGIPLFGKAIARMAPAGIVVEQRHQAMITGGNLWEAAREIARQTFHAAGESPPTATAERVPLPNMHWTGIGWMRRRTLAKHLEQLWRLAHGNRPRPITAREFRELVAKLDEIKAALHDGNLRLEPPNR